MSNKDKQNQLTEKRQTLGRVTVPSPAALSIDFRHSDRRYSLPTKLRSVKLPDFSIASWAAKQSCHIECSAQFARSPTDPASVGTCASQNDSVARREPGAMAPVSRRCDSHHPLQRGVSGAGVCRTWTNSEKPIRARNSRPARRVALEELTAWGWPVGTRLGPKRTAPVPPCGPFALVTLEQASRLFAPLAPARPAGPG